MDAILERGSGTAPGRLSLEDQGLAGLGTRHWNAATAVLAEQALSRGEGTLSDQGALVFETGKYTGRSPRDKFIVREPSCEAEVDWGEVNQPFDPERFDALYDRVVEHLRGREVWVQDAFGGTDPAHRLPIRVVCERAYHALFARQLFVRPTPEELAAPPARVHHHRRARLPRRPGARRHPERGLHPPELRPPARPDRRDAVRRARSRSRSSRS